MNEKPKNIELKDFQVRNIQLITQLFKAGVIDDDIVETIRLGELEYFSLLDKYSLLEQKVNVDEKTNLLKFKRDYLNNIVKTASRIFYDGFRQMYYHISLVRFDIDDFSRFNNQYGNVFPECEPLLTKFKRIIGLDGNAKMSKSLNNAILISDEPDEVKNKLKKAVTDPQKVRKGDPGRPEICLVFTYHKKFNPNEVEEIENGCKSGVLGCVECKLKCSEKISKFFEPVREKRKELESKPDLIMDILIDGENRARKTAQATMNEVHEKMKFG